uniref:Orf207 n=1 Tax=Amoebidium parasiticum TaxID=4881 RepID=Q8M0C8_AMOPA|nr:Orf207 [Amoebidium parasiticum]
MNVLEWKWKPTYWIQTGWSKLSFLWHVYLELISLTSSFPGIRQSIVRGKSHNSHSFDTKNLQCLNELSNILYTNINGKMVKSIKGELFDYLNYRTLAYMIMGDGARKNKGFVICLENFTLQEVVLLLNMLAIKFNLEDLTIQTEDSKPSPFKKEKEEIKKIYRIYFGIEGTKTLLPFIKPYLLDHFDYRISGMTKAQYEQRGVKHKS